MINLPPPPKLSPVIDQWLFRFFEAVSKIGSETTTDHASLSNLNSGSYSHLTSTQKTDLTDSGDSTLHYHSSDRNRANHTGTQTSSTISDFNSAVNAAVSLTPGTIAANVLEVQVFGP